MKGKFIMKKRLGKVVYILLICILIVTNMYSGSFVSNAAAAPKKIVMNRKKVKLSVGKTFKLRVKKVKPAKAAKTVKYKTGKKKIATVSKKGVIRAKRAGKTTITVTSEKNKKIRAKVKVTVIKEKTGTGSITPVSNITPIPTESADVQNVNPTESPDTDIDEEPAVIYNGEKTVPIIMDSAYENSKENKYAQRSYDQIVRAVRDLRQDIGMVTGAIDYREIQSIFDDNAETEEERLYYADPDKVPEFITDISNINTDDAIIVGSIEDSGIIKNLMDRGKLDEAKKLKGVWEGYVIKQVKNPVKGVDNALVVAGSDARGTIYGVYTISEKIGVSPFYWYSDVPVEVKERVEFDASVPIIDNGPDVKYRGIFINDEEKSNGWAEQKFTEDGKNGPGVNYYRKVFELMLRLKANTLWPAMHGCSTAFNKVTDENGISVNAKEADRYGIIMGASHCEILLRNNVGEWEDWFKENKNRFDDVKYQNDYYKAYDFTLNREMLLEYWRERLVANKDFESILTVGVRGPHDEAFNCENLSMYNGNTESEKKVEFMKDVIASQRELIAEVYGEENVQNIPQVLIPYNEINDVYNAGLNEYMLWDGSKDYNGDGVTDWRDDNSDIMLMWAEDNENYLRQDLTDEEAERKGGAGIYYHISYWGPPSSYLWLNSTSLYTMSEQMHRGYNIGADDYWILNVGDIKPGEPGMEFFLKMSWDSNYWNDTTVNEYFVNQAKRDYGMNDEDAHTMADAVSEYYKMNGARKAEFYAKGDYGVSPKEFSTTAYGDETMRWLKKSHDVTDTIEKLYDKLSDKYKNAFYEQLYYNMLALNDIIEKFMYYEKNLLAASQGRVGSANVYAQLSKEAGERVYKRLDDFNSINNNKWTGFMDCEHIGRGYVIVGDGGEKYEQVYDISGGVGASCENYTAAGNGVLRFNSHITDEKHYFDVFDRNVISEKWIAKADKDWIVLSDTSGETNTEQRVAVTVDWSKITGKQTGTISVYNADENGVKTGSSVAVFTVEADGSDIEYGDNKGYIEADGYVSIEAEHYSDMITGNDGSYFGLIKSNGMMSDTMKALDDTAYHTTDWDNTARLVYRVYFENAGTYQLKLRRPPVLNEGSENGVNRSMDIAVGTNGNTPSVLKGTRSTGGINWGNILNMCEILTCNITVNQGWNDIIVYRSDASFVFDNMYIETIKGAAPDSVFGPPESPNNISESEIHDIGALPNELKDYNPEQTIVMAEFDNVSININESKSIEFSVYSTNGNKVTVTAESSDTSMVTVDILENRITVSSKETAGNVVITVKAVSEGCQEIRREFRVNVRDASKGGLYIEEKGELVINAVDAVLETAYSWTETMPPCKWEQTSDKNGVALTPDVNSKWDNTNDLGNAPSINFKVKINTGGTYYLFINMSNPNDNADSYHVLVDGVYRYTHNSGDMSGNMIWKSNGKGVELNAGEHTITIAAREDGLVINQLCFTTDKNKTVKDGILEIPSSRSR